MNKDLRLLGIVSLLVLFIQAIILPPVCRAKKIALDFCQGLEYQPGLITGIPLEEKDLPALKEYVKIHKDFFEQFMKYYRQEIPTYIVFPPKDYRTMNFLEIIHGDIPDFNTLRTSGRAVAVFGDYFKLTGRISKASLVYRQVFKCGIDSGYGFGTQRTLITHMISIAIQKVALERLALLMGNRCLDNREEKTILESIDLLLEKRAGLSEALDAERTSLEKFNFKEHFSLSLFSTGSSDETEKPTKVKKSLYDRFLIFFYGRAAQKHFDRMLAFIYDEGEKAMKRGFVDGEADLDRVSEYIMKLSREAGGGGERSLSGGERLAATLIAIAVPGIKRAYIQDLKISQYRRGLEIIHLLNEFYRDRNAYPNSLTELRDHAGRPLPGDVYTNADLIYRRSGDSFVLYSPGADKQDDNMERYKDIVLYSP